MLLYVFKKKKSMAMKVIPCVDVKSIVGVKKKKGINVDKVCRKCLSVS
jgi:hypothetical protein